MTKIRQCRFQPYRKGVGPRFTLTLFDTERVDSYGKHILGYQFKRGRKTLFQGSDFHCSPLNAIDSDATVAALMGFLTLRPGDTDADYFDSYTPEQREFAEQDAETLSAEIDFRFNKEEYTT